MKKLRNFIFDGGGGGEAIFEKNKEKFSSRVYTVRHRLHEIKSPKPCRQVVLELIIRHEVPRNFWSLLSTLK